MTSRLSNSRVRFIENSLRGLGTILLVVFVVQCAQEPEPKSGLQERYLLSDAEAKAWDTHWVDEAESVSTLFWGHVGKGEFDQAMLMIERYDDAKMKNIFRGRLSTLWQSVYSLPAASFTEEPQVGLGPSETVGFETWGELLSGGFQRAVLCDDSITVYFVFKGYWQTKTQPFYAAVGCGDFGTESPNWRPLPSLVFSVDDTEQTISKLGEPQVYITLDGFLLYLRSRTFGSF